MKLPISTGQAAHLLGVREPRLNGLVRKGKIQPHPPIASGRRQWELEHLLQAAKVLGADEVELRDRLVAGVLVTEATC